MTIFLRVVVLLFSMCALLITIAIGLGNIMPYDGTLIWLKTEGTHKQIQVVDIQRGIATTLINVPRFTRLIDPDPFYQPQSHAIGITLQQYAGDIGHLLYRIQLNHYRVGERFLVPMGENIAWSGDLRDIAYEVPSLIDGEFPYLIRTSLDDAFDPQRLLPRPNLNSNPAWSPTAPQVALRTTNEASQGIIKVVNVTDGTLQYAVDGINGILDVQWRPDGQRISFIRLQEALTGMYTVAPDGSDLTRWTTIVPTHWESFWSPDSRYLAYVALVGRARGVAVLDTVTGDVYLASGDLDADRTPIFWSPDSRHIAFTARTGYERGSPRELFVARADGSQLTQLTQGMMQRGLNILRNVVWSPDGDELIYAQQWHSNVTALVRVHIHTGETTIQTYDEGIYPIVWVD